MRRTPSCAPRTTFATRARPSSSRCRATRRPDPRELRRAFDRAHEERYGYADPDAGLELVSVRVAVALPGAEPHPAAWDGLPEATTEGPAVVRLPGSTLVVPEGWRAHAEDDAVVMER